MPAILVDPSSQTQRSPAKRSWIVASCCGMHTEPLGAFAAVGRGGTGSGVVFSSTTMVVSVCEASDMGEETRVGGRGEEGG